ncbi:hypothetical protein Tco_0777072 [Tanacetum coccineum]
MSSSTVTYTSVYTDSEPGRVFWGADEEPSDGGPPRVIVYEYDGLHMQPVDPPSPDYVPGPKHPPSPDYVPGPEHPPSPVDVPYISKPEYLEYLAPSNTEEPLEDQPLPADASPTSLSPGYVADSDPARRRRSTWLRPTLLLYLLLPQTKVPFAQTRLPKARKTVRLEPPISASIEARIAEHAAAPTPPLHVASPPLPLPSPLTTSPTDAGAPLGYREVRIWMRTASPPLLLPSTSHMTDILKAEMPPRKRACLTALAPELEIGENSADGAARQPWTTLEADLRRDKVMETGYGIIDT